VAGSRQEGRRFGPSFDGTRLDPIRALADSLGAARAVERLPCRKAVPFGSEYNFLTACQYQSL